MVIARRPAVERSVANGRACGAPYARIDTARALRVRTEKPIRCKFERPAALLNLVRVRGELDVEGFVVPSERRDIDAPVVDDVNEPNCID